MAPTAILPQKYPRNKPEDRCDGNLEQEQNHGSDVRFSLRRMRQRWKLQIILVCSIASTFSMVYYSTVVEFYADSRKLSDIPLILPPVTPEIEVKFHDEVTTQNATTVIEALPRDDPTQLLSHSPECSRQKGTTEFHQFCKKRTYSKNKCQKRKWKPPTEVQRTLESEPTPCKTIWITGMSLGFEGKHDVANGGDGYALQYVAALRSYRANARDVLQPVLILLTPSLSSASSASKRGAIESLASRFTRWLEDQGVIVIRIDELSFQDLVFRAFPDYADNGAIAYYLRFDIWRILLQSHRHLLEQPGICGDLKSRNNVVLYTDTDILFVQPVGYQQIKELKDQLTKDKFLMYGQDFLIDRRKPSNTGVMFLHLEGFAKNWPRLLDWGKKRVENGDFPIHDQEWLNRFYAHLKKWSAHNLLLPPSWNWKVYWELEESEPPKNATMRLPSGEKEGDETTITTSPQIPIQLVHFHGPKPKNGVEEIASCDTRAVLDVLGGKHNANTRAFHPDYEPFVSHGMCCDSGKTAAWILKLYNNWLPSSSPW